MDRSGNNNSISVIRPSLSSSSSSSSSDGKLFDASQYAFFGQDSLDMATDLGCIEVEQQDNPLNGLGEDGYRLFDREEESGVGSLSDMDDLSTIFSKVTFNLNVFSSCSFIGGGSK
uniref:Protein PAT1 homolog 1-like n=1 Tax=Tanacetum cinerariifolium TaxID=118510 RepID=A0A6L2K7V5_TANCI|nr:protein PAT1 homolog 1-like [Tanacetum cinerariifolium]